MMRLLVLATILCSSLAFHGPGPLVKAHSSRLQHFASSLDTPVTKDVVQEETDVTGNDSDVSKLYQEPKLGSTNNWMRKLNTREDLYGIHKINNGAFVISTTVILATMTMNGFQEFPDWLAPFDRTVLVCSLFQVLTTCRMIHARLPGEKRAGDGTASVSRTQVEMALSCLLFAIYSSWQSPYCPSILLDKATFSTTITPLILATAYLDYEATVLDYEPIQKNVATHYEKKKPDNFLESVMTFVAFRGFAFGTIMNLIFLADYLFSDHNRDWYQQMMSTGYELPFLSGTQVPYAYFTMVLNTALLAYQSFAGTLAHRRVISIEKSQILVGWLTVIQFGSLVHLLNSN